MRVADVEETGTPFTHNFSASMTIHGMASRGGLGTTRAAATVDRARAMVRAPMFFGEAHHVGGNARAEGRTRATAKMAQVCRHCGASARPFPARGWAPIVGGWIWQSYGMAAPSRRAFPRVWRWWLLWRVAPPHRSECLVRHIVQLASITRGKVRTRSPVTYYHHVSTSE